MGQSPENYKILHPDTGNKKSNSGNNNTTPSPVTNNSSNDSGVIYRSGKTGEQVSYDQGKTWNDTGAGSDLSKYEGTHGGGGGKGNKKRNDNPLNLPTQPSNPIIDAITKNQIEQQSQKQKQLLERSNVDDIIPPTIPKNRTKKNVDDYNKAVEDYNKKIENKKAQMYKDIQNNPEYSGGYTLAKDYNPYYINPSYENGFIESGTMVVPQEIKPIKQNVETTLTPTEKIQAKIRKKTGISVPTPTQAYNYLFTNADYGTPESQQKVTLLRVVNEVPDTFFIKAPYSLFSSTVGGVTGNPTLGRYAGYAGVAGTLLATSSAKVVGEAAATTIGAIYGTGSLVSGASNVFSSNTSYNQKLFGVGEIVLGSLLLGKPLGFAGEKAVNASNKFVTPILAKSRQGITKSIEYLKPFKTTEYGYLGKSERLAVKEKMGNFKQLGFTPTQEAAYGFNIAKQEIGFVAGDVYYGTLRTVDKAKAFTFNVGKTIRKNTIQFGKKIITPIITPISRGARIVKNNVVTVFERRYITDSYGYLGKSKRLLTKERLSNFKQYGLSPTGEAVYGFNIAKQNIKEIPSIFFQTTKKVGAKILSPIKESLSGASSSFGIKPIVTTAKELPRIIKKGYSDIKEPFMILKRSNGIEIPFFTKTETVISPVVSQVNKIPTKVRIQPFTIIKSKIGEVGSKVKSGIGFVGSKITKPIISYKNIIYSDVKAAYEKSLSRNRLAQLIFNEEVSTKTIINEPWSIKTVGTQVDNKGIEANKKLFEVATKSGEGSGIVASGTGNQALMSVMSEVPQIVSGQSTKLQGEFTGKGFYERVGFTSTLLPKQGSSIQTEGQLTFTPTITSQFTLSSQIEKLSDITSPKISAKLKSNISSGSSSRSNQLQSLASVELTKDAIKEDVLQRDRVKFLEKQIIRQRYLEKQIPAKKKLLGFIKWFRNPESNKKQYKPKTAYDVIIYTRGKEKTIASGLPENLAKKIGSREVLGTLRASFKLKAKGTTTQEDIEFALPKTFRMSKVDKNRYVQKLNTRFGVRSETKEAQFFRKQKVGKIKWF